MNALQIYAAHFGESHEAAVQAVHDAAYLEGRNEGFDAARQEYQLVAAVASTAPEEESTTEPTMEAGELTPTTEPTPDRVAADSNTATSNLVTE